MLLKNHVLHWCMDELALDLIIEVCIAGNRPTAEKMLDYCPPWLHWWSSECFLATDYINADSILHILKETKTLYSREGYSLIIFFVLDHCQLRQNLFDSLRCYLHCHSKKYIRYFFDLLEIISGVEILFLIILDCELDISSKVIRICGLKWLRIIPDVAKLKGLKVHKKRNS